MDKERFSLLLLEPNEIYFEDFSADMTENADNVLPNEECSAQSGRLKICSKSIVFDPRDKRKPLIKIPYKDCEKIDSVKFSFAQEKNCLLIRCTQYVEMLDKNIISPYRFLQKPKTFSFTFHFVNVDECKQHIKQLHRASTLHAAEQNSMIAVIVFSRHSRVKFNPLWLNDIYEKTLYDCKVDEINPLVLNPGRLLLTNKFMYFQPYNNIQPLPVIKIDLRTITSLTRRRFLLRHTGLEIKWHTEDKHLLYVSFVNSDERKKFFDAFRETDFQIPAIEPRSMTLKWQNHLISNYEYLLYLNSLADRTCQDLTQYPVFPWVINDYTSNEIDLEDEKVYRDLTKPVGALNPTRLAALKERCSEMDDPKFLYGSHYSTPGFVLFYLVRKFPHLMLCLQNGRFDHPDRMFNSVPDTFRNCLVNMSDFKELIPEFYDVENEGDFLLNMHKINFGTRSDGSPVNHVVLPPWAKGSSKTFVNTLRNALESEHVSKNLHHWIDLVFGYKQRGAEALKADNLFYHLCYEGSVDLDSVQDLAARHALEVQISEFGQIPKQLFNKPHIARKEKSVEVFEGPLLSTLDCKQFSNLRLEFSYIAHKQTVSTIVVDGDVIISTGMDGILKCYKMSQRRQIRSISLGKLPLSTCIKMKNCNILIIGSWDNSISLYNCDYGKITDVIPAHDDAVSCLHLINNHGILISGSWDCSIKVWKGFTGVDNRSFRLSEALIAYLPLEEKVLRLDCRLICDVIQIAVGIASGEIFLWKLKINDDQLRDIQSFEPSIIANHNGEITSLSFNESGTKLASCSENQLIVTDVNTGMGLLNQSLKNLTLCVEWCGETDVLLIGDGNGNLSVWDLSDGKLKCDKKLSNGPINCIKFLSDSNTIITAGRDNNDNSIKCWSVK